MTPALYVGGAARHGVVRLARDIATAVRAIDPSTEVVDRPPGAGALHVHFTDRLWGATPEAAGSALAALGRRLALTVTLHDVPQASDGAERLERRRECYRAVVAASAAVACSSAHEAALLRETGVLPADTPGPRVIPLPAGAPPAGAPPATRGVPRSVALLGWIYPGKGHAEAIDAVAALPDAVTRGRPVAVIALGGPAAGHGDELARLRARAGARGIAFTATGWLDDGQLARRCRAAAVPLAAHTHLSASASINAWIAAGRRPLIADGRYAREIDALRPTTVWRYDARRLGEAIAAALAEPDRTWLAPGTDTRPHLADTARAYLSWWGG